MVRLCWGWFGSSLAFFFGLEGVDSNAIFRLLWRKPLGVCRVPGIRSNGFCVCGNVVCVFLLIVRGVVIVLC